MTFRSWSEPILKEDLAIPKNDAWYKMSHPNRWRKHRGMALSETDCSEVSTTTIHNI
ncbi:hypothetical protein Hanom_Chr04g00332551 [Helianthus anomalus]